MRFGLLRSIEDTLQHWAKGLSGGLEFRHNFRATEWTGEIEAGKQVLIPHDLGVIPTRFLVENASGSMTLVVGEKKYRTATHFPIKNKASTSTFEGKILILP